MYCQKNFYDKVIKNRSTIKKNIDRQTFYDKMIKRLSKIKNIERESKKTQILKNP